LRQILYSHAALQRNPNLAPDLMTDAPGSGLDYSRTLYLPQTDFPMRGGLPQKEPEILARWARENLYAALRDSGKGRPTPTAMSTSALR
jgi:hypothetical protein